jgi:hypothetical protein
MRTASTTIAVRATAARAGAISRRQRVSPRGSRVKNAMSATDVTASGIRMPNPPVVPSQKNRSVIGDQPPRA